MLEKVDRDASMLEEVEGEASMLEEVEGEASILENSIFGFRDRLPQYERWLGDVEQQHSKKRDSQLCNRKRVPKVFGRPQNSNPLDIWQRTHGRASKTHSAPPGARVQDLCSPFSPIFMATAIPMLFFKSTIKGLQFHSELASAHTTSEPA